MTKPDLNRKVYMPTRGLMTLGDAIRTLRKLWGVSDQDTIKLSLFSARGDGPDSIIEAWPVLSRR